LSRFTDRSGWTWMAGGFGLAEAPRPDGHGGAWFSDLGGGVFHVDGQGSVGTVVPRRRGVGGLIPHAGGGLVVAGRDVVHVDGTKTRTLLALPGVTGFNDLTTDAEGRLLVGALRYRPFAGDEPVPGEVWRLDAAGATTCVARELTWPNGLAVAGDGRRLFAADFHAARVAVYELDADGVGGPPTVLAASPRGAADGLALDEQDGIWLALGPGAGIARFSAEGKLEEVLDVPAAFVSSVAFDGDELLCTVGGGDRGGGLLRASVGVRGAAVEPALSGRGSARPSPRVPRPRR
jgi:gluconolactonase